MIKQLAWGSTGNHPFKKNQIKTYQCCSTMLCSIFYGGDGLAVVVTVIKKLWYKVLVVVVVVVGYTH